MSIHTHYSSVSVHNQTTVHQLGIIYNIGDILQIVRQFCLWFRRLSPHRENRFSSEKTKRSVCICAPRSCRFQMEIQESWGQTRVFYRCTAYLLDELMLDKTTSSLDRGNLHEVFLTVIKIQRKKKYSFCNFRKTCVCFYYFTTSPGRTHAKHFNKIYLNIIIII